MGSKEFIPHPEYSVTRDRQTQRITVRHTSGPVMTGEGEDTW